MVNNMRKIQINIHDDTLTFSYKNQLLEVPKNLLNTNVISNDEVVFSDKYIAENSKIVASFLKELALEKKIKKLVISNNDMADMVLDVVSKVNEIEYIYFKENLNMTFKICEKIISNRNIKAINCYSIPTFMIELLDKAGVMVESRCEILFTSDFMGENNLTSYSKMFYKMNLRVKAPLSKNDLDDLEAFCSINKYLKNVHLDKCDINTIAEIVTRLAKNKIKNVKIFIHDNIHDEKIVETLRKINKKYQSKYKVSLKLSYDEKYIKDNYLKQVIFTTLKVCSLLAFAIIGGALGYVILNNKISEKNVKEINEQINTILSTVTDEEENDSNNSNNNSTNYLDNLLVLNSDTVGWLTVKNTKVDYPVVQTNDNNYYLRRNYNKKKDYNGWIFMDYRNDPNDLDKNTIIYGHNIFYSDVMFSSLRDVTKKSWYTNEENLTITFNSLTQNMKWKIFSIYSINVTSDYLKKDFDTESEWYDFLDLISERSDYEFDTEVGKDDKILTLSTCLQNDRRLVIHAVLMK